VSSCRGYPRASETTKAINYGLNHCNGLCRFPRNGRIEIDTNTVERMIALNRKNALFAGSDEGGAKWAIVASLIEPCNLPDGSKIRRRGAPRPLPQRPRRSPCVRDTFHLARPPSFRLGAGLPAQPSIVMFDFALEKSE
jgi:hypothetical protein